jgi:hypothetical protein
MVSFSIFLIFVLEGENVMVSYCKFAESACEFDAHVLLF